MRTSLKYIFDPYLTNWYRQEKAISSDTEIYLTERYIGKGIVHGTNTGGFQIHYNPKKKRIEEIYLVA